MSITKKTQTYFDASAGDNFRTPANKFTSNNWLKGKTPLTPDLAYFKVPGFPVEERRVYALATAGEFDVEIPWDAPGGPTPDNWDLLTSSTTSVVDSKTCAVSTVDLKDALARIKHNPEIMAELVKDIVICRQGAAYDQTPEQVKQALLDKVTDQVLAPPDEFTSQIWTDILGADFAASGTDGGFVKAWINGPDALAAYAESQGLTSEWGTLANYIGPQVQALADIDDRQNFPQLVLYEFGKAHGPDWNLWLEKSLNKYASNQAGTNAVMGKTLAAAFGESAGGAVVPVFSVAAGKKSQEIRLATNLAEAESIIDSQQLNAQLMNQEAIVQAIDWMLECSSAGAMNLVQLADSSAFGVDVINLVCLDEDFAKLNPPALALALSNELKARRGEVLPLVVGRTTTSALPWILAGGGFLLGGPLGAGAGFAIGKSLGKP